MSRKYSIIGSFDFAIQGVKTAIKKEPNFRFHLLAAVLAMAGATILGFSPTEWVVLFFAIALVLILELVNTSLESIVNIVSPQRQEKARVAKDVSAAAVLVAAVAAVLVGVYLFLPKLIQMV